MIGPSATLGPEGNTDNGGIFQSYSLITSFVIITQKIPQTKSVGQIELNLHAMKTTFQILMLSLLIACTAHGQGWEWAAQGGGAWNDYGVSIATDVSGNAFIVGNFYHSPIAFGAFTLPNAGNKDAFIVKYSSIGTVLWAKSAGGNGDDGANYVATDASGNVYVTGFFNSPTITFDTVTLTNADSFTYLSDIFVVKYDPLGNVAWAKSFGDSNNDVANSICVDTAGNVYIAGNYSSTRLRFGATTLINTGGADMFVTKLDPAGNVRWAKSARGSGDESANSVCADRFGHAFVTGTYSSPSLIFGTDTLLNAGMDDIFLTKYDSAGHVVWARRAGEPQEDVSASVAADAFGNAYITGYYNSLTLVFGPDLLINAGANDMFLAKYDSSGNVAWARGIGGGCNELAYSVHVDPFNKVLIAGSYSSHTLTFGAITITNSFYTCFYTDLFIAKYDTSGAAIWAISTGGNNGDNAESVTTDTAGNAYVTGGFGSPTIPFGTTTLIGGGGVFDIFTAKYNFCLFSSTISGPSSLCAGATITISDTSSGGTWSSGNTGIATVSSLGSVSGVSAGVVTMSYSVPYSCGIGVTTTTIVVNPLADAGTITGSDSVCEYATITLSDASAGGVWSSSNTNTTVSSGVITGITAGTSIISYSVTNSCNTAYATITVTVIPEYVCLASVRGMQPGDGFNVYPNPSGGLLHIDMPAATGNAIITIMDVTGNVVAKSMLDNSNLRAITYDLSDLPSGSYIIKAQTGDAVYRDKVTILK